MLDEVLVHDLERLLVVHDPRLLVAQLVELAARSFRSVSWATQSTSARERVKSDALVVVVLALLAYVGRPDLAHDLLDRVHQLALDPLVEALDAGDMLLLEV